MKILSWHSITVCGMKGSGKTNLEKFLLQKYPKVLVFDVLGEFPEYPSYIPTTDNPKELDQVAKAIWNQGNIMLLVSESELYLPNGATLPPNVFKLITRGRHRNVGMIADTRRIANLHKTFFSLSEHVFIFRHFSPTDQNYLKGFLPMDTKTLANLQDYHFYHYTKGKVSEHEPVEKMA